MPSANAANRLIDHYRATARQLPWRAAAGASIRDPYRVWLSEVMLQQTTVAAVIPRFNRFVERWPTIEALASAADEDILSEWAGLGYYARARNLIACARAVATAGGFPRGEQGLRALPGVGDYTAAAVAAIAFGEATVPVDTNVRRVASRIYRLPEPSNEEIRRLLGAILPAGAAGDFAQALMDLGATICRPSVPQCSICPLASECAAYLTGETALYPAPKSKKERPHRYGTAYWIERDAHIWLCRRPAKGLLGGMSALPGPDWTDTPPRSTNPLLASIRHVFTHFALTLSIVACDTPEGEGWWQPLDDLDDAGLPTLYRKAIDAVLSARIHDAAA